MAAGSDRSRASLVAGAAAGAPRDIETVPFVELAGGRLIGVVSSGSDVERVYCCSIEAGTLAYYSSTNNNRPDAGTTKRLNWLADAAFAQFGRDEVVRGLSLPGSAGEVDSPGDLVAAVARHGALRPEPSGAIFSRFLDYLRLVEREAEAGPVPEMAWFVA